MTDTSDKLEGAKMEKIARLAYWIGLSVANADSRPQRLGTRKNWQGEER